MGSPEALQPGCIAGSGRHAQPLAHSPRRGQTRPAMAGGRPERSQDAGAEGDP